MKKGICVSFLTDKLSTARAARFFEKAYGRFLPEKGARQKRALALCKGRFTPFDGSAAVATQKQNTKILPPAPWH